MWLTLVIQRTFAKGLIHSVKHTASTYYMEGTWWNLGSPEIPIGHPPHHQGAHTPGINHSSRHNETSAPQMPQGRGGGYSQSGKLTPIGRTLRINALGSWGHGRSARITLISQGRDKTNSYAKSGKEIVFHILIKTPVISWQMSVYLFRNYINMYFKWPNRQIFKNKLNSHYTLVEAS